MVKKSNVRLAKTVEENKVGHEIVNWDATPSNRLNKMKCLAHYNYFYDYKDAYKWVSNWVKDNKTKTEAKYFKSNEAWRVSITLGGLVKMLSNGATLSDEEMRFVNDKVNALIERGKQKKKLKVVKTIQKKSPAEIVKEKTSDFIAEVESVVDEYVSEISKKHHDKMMNYSVFDELTKIDAPYVTAKHVHDYYLPIQKEIEELIAKKDDQLEEAYSYMKAVDRKRYLKFIKKIVDDAMLYANGKKAVRKPRAKKVKGAGEQTKNVKYLTSSAEYKITSIDPTNIVGATMLVLFNTAYRTVTLLESEKGFTVKGTTVYGFDPESSVKKSVRKPDDLIKALSKTTKLRTRKVIKALKTKDQDANGRINEKTIILKAFK